MQAEILALLQLHPEGLTAKEIRRHLVSQFPPEKLKSKINALLYKELAGQVVSCPGDGVAPVWKLRT